VLVSDLSGRSNIFYKLKEHGLEEKLNEDSRKYLLEKIKQMEFEGYELEAAEGTFELMVREALNPGKNFFQVVSFDVTTKMGRSGGSLTMATLSLQAADGLHTETAVGNGPVNALDLCLRECLVGNYPAIKNVKLTDYKVRVIDSKKGTAAKVRVLIEWSDQKRSWATVGVSDNVIEASWKALVDAIRLELMRLSDKDDALEKAVEDYCWGV
jgi:2-isopropylmalate synthase